MNLEQWLKEQDIAPEPPDVEKVDKLARNLANLIDTYKEVMAGNINSADVQAMQQVVRNLRELRDRTEARVRASLERRLKRLQ